MASSNCKVCTKQDVCKYKNFYQSFRDCIEEYVRKNIPLEDNVFSIDTKCKHYNENYSFIGDSAILTTTLNNNNVICK